ncbi:hypothetical protein SAMN04487773_3238 [Enterobacter sp. kpr-6]|uniref:P-loop NTPase fold protein n=1 Tax=Enterobacter sp. kpr-6 TaxID=1761782 RepID=UPI0008EADF36|nr:P-loop NTPase fold protein [Enterobacter sp. kpr-6]SFR13787.1 hypothetical protein SAMN04487773_3238 [Enterobacter sp. kpr-6]
MSQDNLQAYLDYYINLDAPGFAVLITGEWGSGKTHQILNAIPLELQCHVSLFGISDSQEVYGTVFAKMFPGKSFAKKMLDLTKDMTSELNGVTFGAGALAGSIISPLIKQTVDRSKIIIFDDLERCPMNNKEILGVINQYIEHHQCKVIILAHDKKTHNDFITTKEKIIGHTIQIVPQIDEAANTFFKSNFRLNNYREIKPLIINTFKKTNCKSLRILKYVINDCDRLLRCLEPVHLKNTLAMKSLFTLFCIVNIEHRSGNISISDIESIPEDYLQYAIFAQPDKVENPEFEAIFKKRREFYKKYDETEIRNGILDSELLANIIGTGYYPKINILNSLNSSHYFVQQHRNPPCLTIINFDYLDSNIINSAISEMFEDFKNFKIVHIGEMMHSFCMSYYLSEQKEINQTFDELYEFQITYIDKLLEKDLLPPNSLYFDPYENDIYERSHSISYWISDSYQLYIDKITNHLKYSRDISKRNKYPTYTQEILDALDSDLENFKMLLLGNGSVPGKFSNIDILKSIPPKDFLLHWLMLPVDCWNKVGMILNSRYRGAAHNILNREKLWLNELCLYILFEARLHKGLERTRIERLIPYHALKSF